MKSKYVVHKNDSGWYIWNKNSTIYLCNDGVVRNFYDSHVSDDLYYYKTRGKAREALNQYLGIVPPKSKIKLDNIIARIKASLTNLTEALKDLELTNGKV